MYDYNPKLMNTEFQKFNTNFDPTKISNDARVKLLSDNSYSSFLIAAFNQLKHARGMEPKPEYFDSMRRAMQIGIDAHKQLSFGDKVKAFLRDPLAYMQFLYVKERLPAEIIAISGRREEPKPAVKQAQPESASKQAQPENPDEVNFYLDSGDEHVMIGEDVVFHDEVPEEEDVKFEVEERERPADRQRAHVQTRQAQREERAVASPELEAHDAEQRAKSLHLTATKKQDYVDAYKNIRDKFDKAYAKSKDPEMANKAGEWSIEYIDELIDLKREKEPEIYREGIIPLEKQSDPDIAEIRNAWKKAIGFLIKAAQQGHPEAIKTLRDFEEEASEEIEVPLESSEWNEEIFKALAKEEAERIQDVLDKLEKP